MMFRRKIICLCGVLAGCGTAWAQLAGPVLKTPAAQQLPEIPTYMVIGDMAKGVSLRDLLIERKLLDEKGGGQLAGLKFKAVILNTNDTQHPFPDASRQSKDFTLRADSSDSGSLVFRSLLKIIGRVDTKTWTFVKDAEARWKLVVLYLPAEAGPFQVALFDAAQVGPTAQPFGVTRLGRNLLTAANNDGALKVTVAPELQARLPFHAGTADQPLTLHLTSAKLREGERSPNRAVAAAARQAQRDCVCTLQGLPTGALVLDFATPAIAPAGENATAVAVKAVVAEHPLPMTCYTDPSQKFDRIGQRLLLGYCPEELKSFTAYLKQHAGTSVQRWDPWDDYVEYLRELLSAEKIHATEVPLEAGKTAVHFVDTAKLGDAERGTRPLRTCQLILTRVILNARRITEASKPSTDSSTLGAGPSNKVSIHFAQEWALLLNDVKAQASIMEERRHFKENGGKVPASRLEPAASPPTAALAAPPAPPAAVTWPQTLAELGTITLNMKLQGYDWPLIEFSEAP